MGEWGNTSPLTWGDGAKKSRYWQNLPYPFRNHLNSTTLGSSLKPARAEILRPLKKKGLIIKTAADFMHQEWNAVSIIHLWVHVIYLQLELLSIQQLKPKNCWDTADEKTFAGLWDLAFLVLNDDHTVWIPCPITNLGWRTGSCRASIYICGSIHSPPRVPKAPLLLRLS